MYISDVAVYHVFVYALFTVQYVDCRQSTYPPALKTTRQSTYPPAL